VFKKEALDGIRLLEKEWVQGPLGESLQKTKERKAEFMANSKFPIKRVYTPLDLEEMKFDYNKDLGFPGMFPYTRGIDPLMYREIFG